MFLPKTQWGPFFDQISRDLDGERAVVEIQGIEFIGDHRQARCLPLLGIVRRRPIRRCDNVADLLFSQSTFVIRSKPK
jgi:hypothetical protein